MTEDFFVLEVQKWERLLYRISWSMLGSEADCCDAVQEALLKAWQCRSRIQEERFRAYLTRILINECHNIGRRKKKITPFNHLPDRPVPPDESLDIRDALMHLTEKERLMLVMYHMEGFSLQEIAKAMQMPLGTVKWRITKARKAFQAEWLAENGKGGAQK